MYAGAAPGLVFSQDYQYNPRWYYGTPGDIKVVSCCATETLLPGTVAEVDPTVTDPDHVYVRQARGGGRLVGVVVYDPNHFDSSVQYQQGDMVPVLRHGACFCSFVTNQPPFANPVPLQTASYYPGAGNGQFTTDPAGIPVPQIVFQVAAADYYPNSDGSPQADLPLPVPGVPPGTMDTTFGAGVALVEVNLGV